MKLRPKLRASFILFISILFSSNKMETEVDLKPEAER